LSLEKFQISFHWKKKLIFFWFFDLFSSYKISKMRRGVGIGSVTKKDEVAKTFEAVGSEMKTAELGQMKQQMQTFHQNLEEFAKKYKKDINKNPEFRKYFQEMCNKIGVDPLASNKGFWAEMLGVGDFYYELAVQIIEVCLRNRTRTGGLIEINELKEYLEKTRGKNSQPISFDDIERAAKKIKVLGNGFQVLSVGSKKIIQSVPAELSNDHILVLAMVSSSASFITASRIIKEQQWKPDRVEKVLGLLLKESMAWCDDQHEGGERAYWFPSLMKGALADAD